MPRTQGQPDLFSTPSLTVARFPLGPYQTNCYVIHQPASASPNACWIVDASFEPAPLIGYVKSKGLVPAALVLTHAHIDHIAGVKELRSAFAGLPIMIHQAEEDWLNDPVLNLSAFSGMPVTSPAATRVLAEGESLDLPGGPWSVVHTPGHSPGSITLHAGTQEIAFVGDALFAGSIGRTDFPGCSFAELERSIRTKLYTLPGKTTIFPGHGGESTIGEEARSNPFVRP
jgi:glyoxylase-like metal-dependent hydrolase (beta-lactamase superfamily II)